MSAAKTRIWLPISGTEAGVSLSYELADDFEAVLEKVHPMRPPSSALEHRQNMVHNLADGGRVAMQPGMVQVVEELEVE